VWFCFASEVFCLRNLALFSVNYTSDVCFFLFLKTYAAKITVCSNNLNFLKRSLRVSLAVAAWTLIGRAVCLDPHCLGCGAMADTGVQEEWSWSDSDGEGGNALDGAASAHRKQTAPTGEGRDTGEHALFACEPHANGNVRLSAPGTGGSDSRKSVKAGVRQMVSLGMCSPQAAEMFLQIESDALGEPPGGRAPGASKDQMEATEARLAAAERALRESEEQQLKLQAELMRLTLNPYQDSSSSRSGGVTAFDVARAQREAEKVMTLQRKVAEGEERERQQATMQAKMEELLRLQEVALSEREEGFGSLEKELAERDAKLRLLSEQLSQLEQTRALEQQAAASEMAEVKAEMAEVKARNAELQEGIVYRDEQLRRTDGEKLRLHEIQMEEKENQLRNLEARLEANGGDQLQTLKSTFSHTLEDRELRLAALEQELKQVKAERDDAQKVCASLQSMCRELRMESEHLQMALTIVEPKVHVLHSMFSDIQLHMQSQLAERDNKITSQQQHLDRTLPRMHGQMEEMKKGMGQRDTQIIGLQHEIASLRCATFVCVCVCLRVLRKRWESVQNGATPSSRHKRFASPDLPDIGTRVTPNVPP
jgi:hypothetical protein